MNVHYTHRQQVIGNKNHMGFLLAEFEGRINSFLLYDDWDCIKYQIEQPHFCVTVYPTQSTRPDSTQDRHEIGGKFNSMEKNLGSQNCEPQRDKLKYVTYSFLLEKIYGLIFIFIELKSVCLFIIYLSPHIALILNISILIFFEGLVSESQNPPTL